MKISIKKKQFSLMVFFVSFFILFAPLWGVFSLGWPHFAVFSLLIIALIISVKYYNVTMLFYFSTMTLYYVLAPMIQSFTGVRYLMDSSGVSDTTVPAITFIISHALGILMGSFVVRAVRNRALSRHQFLPDRYNSIGVATCLLIVMFAIYFLGAENVLLPRNVQAVDLVLSNFELFAFFIVKTIPAFILIYWLHSIGLRKKKWYLSPVFLSLFFFQIVVSNPVNTGRFIALSNLLIVIIFIMVRANRRGSVLWIMGLSPLVALLLLPVTSLLRHGMAAISLEEIYQSFQSLEFSQYTTLVEGMRVEQFPAVNYTLSHLFVIIPKALWESKAGAIGAVVADNAGYVFHNVGIISVYNPYVDYGYIGLIVASILFGILLRKADVFKYTPSFHNRKFIYALCLLVSVPMIFRGDLSTAMVGLYAFISSYEICRVITSLNIRVISDCYNSYSGPRKLDNMLR
jgi:oligosaccharide repeat unit polymerase